MKMIGSLLMGVSILLLVAMFFAIAIPMIMKFYNFPSESTSPEELAHFFSFSMALTGGAVILGPLGLILYIVGWLFSGPDSSSSNE